jgi:hypothetical protein
MNASRTTPRFIKNPFILKSFKDKYGYEYPNHYSNLNSRYRNLGNEVLFFNSSSTRKTWARTAKRVVVLAVSGISGDEMCLAHRMCSGDKRHFLDMRFSHSQKFWKMQFNPVWIGAPLPNRHFARYLAYAYGNAR